MNRDELIEKMARAICCPNAECGNEQPRDGYETVIPCCRFMHTETARVAIEAIEAAGVTLVPVEAKAWLGYLRKLASKGELVVYETGDDRGLEIEEYAELISNAVRAASLYRRDSDDNG